MHLFVLLRLAFIYLKGKVVERKEDLHLLAIWLVMMAATTRAGPGQGQDRARSWESIWVSHMSDRDTPHWDTTCCCLGTLAGSGIESRAAET